MTTDTRPLEPTDDELDELRQANSGRLNFVTFREFRVIARAVLAKWGTPATVGVEPVARLEVGKTKGGVSLTHIAEPAAFQLPEGMYALYTPQQPTQAVPPVGREPLPFTPRQRERLFKNRPTNVGKDLALADWHRVVEFIEVAHGIKGGQHGTE